MSRALYPFALSLTLGLLVTMWLRPGLAQELIEMAGRSRAQSPDRGSSSPAAAADSAPTYDPFAQVPYDSISRPPMQPLPVTRPVNWPGSSASTSTTAQPQTAAPATPQVNSGVTTWNPAGGRYATPVTAAPQSVAQAPLPNVYAPQPPIVQPPPAATTSAALPPTAGNASSTQAPTNPNAPAAPSPQGTFPAAANFDANNLQVWPGPPKDVPEAQMAAKIGREVVLIGDIRAMANNHVFQNKIEIPAEQREAFDRQACRSLLKSFIETKLIYNDALLTIPKEALPKIEADLNGEFDKRLLPKLLEIYGAANAQELDRKMREQGSSLDFMRRNNFEKNLAQGWLQQKIKFKEEVPHSEVLGYYKSHIAEYEFPAKARWEELMVRFDKYPDVAAAHAAIAHLGIAVQQGNPFAEVAKANSHGLTATEGGLWDWTAKGSLTTKEVDEAIFGLPVGALSQIIKTDRGFHIVRVVERTEAGRRQFIDAQPEIKKQIKEQKIQKQINDYLGDLRARTPVWTMFDNEPGGLEGPKQEKRSIFE